MTRVGFEPTTYGLKGLPERNGAGEEYSGSEWSREESGIESGVAEGGREESERTARRTADLNENRANSDAPIQGRATGFLTESRVAWAQTGDGLQGVYPVGSGFSSHRVR